MTGSRHSRRAGPMKSSDRSVNWAVDTERLPLVSPPHFEFPSESPLVPVPSLRFSTAFDFHSPLVTTLRLCPFSLCTRYHPKMGAVALCMRRADDAEWVPINPPSPPPSIPPNLPLPPQYLEWLFSLPLTSSPQFAWYLLSLTRGLLLPLTPTPSILNDISTPPLPSFPPALLPSTPSPDPLIPPLLFAFDSFVVLTPSQTTEVLSLILHSPLHCRRLCHHMQVAPLLASLRIALALLSMLHPNPSSLSMTGGGDMLPVTLLRSYHLSSLLRPLVQRVAWAMSPAAVADPPEGEGEGEGDYREYYLHEVSMEQLKLLSRHLCTLITLMQPDPALTRRQQMALLMATVRESKGEVVALDGEVMENGLWKCVREPTWDRHLMGEIFGYIWEAN